MTLIGLILLAFGLTLAIIGGVWFLTVAFQESISWGLCCLLLYPVTLVFLIMHWDEARAPFLVQLAGAVPTFAGLVLMRSIA